MKPSETAIKTRMRRHKLTREQAEKMQPMSRSETGRKGGKAHRNNHPWR